MAVADGTTADEEPHSPYVKEWAVHNQVVVLSFGVSGLGEVGLGRGEWGFAGCRLWKPLWHATQAVSFVVCLHHVPRGVHASVKLPMDSCLVVHCMLFACATSPCCHELHSCVYVR
jgi:hypothetical protein